MATFNTIAGVGARALWESIGSEAAHRRHLALMYYRATEIKTAAQRANKVYIRYNPAGSATGGTGTGSFAAPYLVRHTADLKALVASLPRTADTALVFFDDDVIPGSIANTNQCSTIDWASVSVGRTNTGTRRPEITGFIPLVDSGGPSSSSHIGTMGAVTGTAVAIDTSGTPGIIIYWVRGRKLTSTTRDDFTIQPYSIAKDVLDCQGTDFSFFSDGTDFVVNLGSGVNAHDLTMLEACCSTAGLIRVTNVNDVAVDDVILEGAGMNQLFASNSGQTLRFEQGGTNVGISRRTRNNWGDYHTAGVFGTGAGGYVTFHDCEFGGHIWDALGGGDALVNYNGAGGYEGARYRCFQRLGGLSGTAAFFTAYDATYMAAHGGTHWPGYNNINSKSPNGLTPGSPYSHSDSSATPGTYLGELDCDWQPTSGHPIINNRMCATVPAVADKDAQTSYVVYSNNRKVACFAISADSLWGVHDRSMFQVTSGVPASFYFQPFGSGAGAAFKGIMLNFELVMTGDGGSWAGKTTKWLDISGSAADFRWINSRIRFTGNTPDNIYTTPGGTFLNTCSLYNCVLSVENGIAAANCNFTNAGATQDFTEGTPGAGGILGLAVYNVQASQVDGITGVVVLGAAGSWATAADVPAACKNATKALPAGIDCWQDFLGKRRSTNQLARSLGTIEANPVADATWRISRPRDRAINVPV